MILDFDKQKLITGLEEIRIRIGTTLILSRQRGLVVKALCLRSRWSRFKTYSRHSIVSLGKPLCCNFPCFVVLASSSNFSHIFIKLQADSDILASPEAGRGNCLPYVLAPPSLSCESGG